MGVLGSHSDKEVVNVSELFDKHGSEFEPTERDVREVVSHYQKYHPRYRFKPFGHRSGDYEMIADALRYNSMETCKLAIDGLHLSEHHKDKYEAIQYAFRDHNLIPFAENAERAVRAKSASRTSEKIKKIADKERDKNKAEMLELGRNGFSFTNSLRKAMRQKTR